MLIFRFGPVPPFGVGVAAWATVIAQVAALAVVLRHTLGGRSAIHIRAHHFRPDLAHMRLALKLGVHA